MEGREVRRSMTLSEHMSAIDGSSHLRDLLKVREEEDGVRQSRRSLTLASALADEKREAVAAGAGSSSTNRTLMDIIREEQRMSGGGFPDGSSSGVGVDWKAFRDRIRLRRAGDAWPDSSGHTDGDDLVISLPTSPVLGGSMTAQTLPRATSGREMIVSEYSTATAATAQPEEASATRAAGGGGIGVGEDTSGRGDGSAGAGETEQQPIRVSLMALLEQTDRYGGVMTAAEDGEEAEVGEGEAEGMFFVCCVCMVRHKGAAFIPCGHTFCRLCSRELWVSRGNCPLCNGYILEILDIF